MTYLLIACTPEEPMPQLPTPAVRIGLITPTSSATPMLMPTLSPTPTPDPYLDLYIDSLAARPYGGGVLQDAGNLISPAGFTRKLFKYRSEGLDMYGFLNIPDGEGPFPVIIMLHGRVESGKYTTVAYSARYADALAKDGFFVIHPNLRRYAPSADGPNQLGIGDTIDTLNLISLLRQQAGSEGMLKKVDASRIGLWGHSMGGGIVLRLLILDADLRGGLLYASISADENANLTHFKEDGRGMSKLEAPRSALSRISPSSYLNEIRVPLSIHHGSADAVVPLEWSEQLCQGLESMGKEVEYIIYPDQAHTFKNIADTQFMENSTTFFRRIFK